MCAVDRVLVNPDAFNASEQWLALLYELDERERSGELRFGLSAFEGDNIDFPDSEVEISIVAPRRRLAGLGPGAIDRDGASISSNSASTVVRISYAGEGVALLPGDLDEVGLAHLADAGQDLTARTLVFQHHGGNVSRSSSAALTHLEFISVAAPERLCRVGGPAKAEEEDSTD